MFVARLRYAATRPLNIIGRLRARAQMVQVLSPEKMLAYFLARSAQQTARLLQCENRIRLRQTLKQHFC